MKNRVIIILILFCFFIASIIITVDYYRAIFVSDFEDVEVNTHEVKKELDTSLNDTLSPSNTNENGKAKIRIFGEILVHENILNDANQNAGGKGERSDFAIGFDFQPMFEEIANDIENADFSICNVSSLVGANDDPNALSGYPLFNSPSKLGDDLVSLGFDGINMVGNHMLDMSDRGFINSVSFWKTKDVHLIGIDSSKDADNIEQFVSTVNGVRIGILSYTANTNGIQPRDEKLPIPYYTFNSSVILKKKVSDEISKLKNISDVVIILVNWGNEIGFELSEQQKEASQIMADAGADVIVGTGPKVIQKLEWLNRGNGRGQTLCFYSPGNMLCSMKYTDNLFGGYLSFDAEKNSDGEVDLRNIVFRPTVVHYDENVRNVKIYPLENYSQERFLSHGSNLLYGSGDYDRYFEILKASVPIEYLPAEIKRLVDE